MTDMTVQSASAADPLARIVHAVSMEEVADILKAAGYRVTAAEQNGFFQLMSASQGIGFVLRPGNVSQDASSHTASTPASYLDCTLSCALQAEGDLPADLAPSWNRTKRFARLAVHAPFLVLEMDVVVAGGVSIRHLRSMIELWDRLIQELLLHLRNRPAMAAAEQETAAGTVKAGRPAAAETKSPSKAAAP